jgi:putative flippase GtrA
MTVSASRKAPADFLRFAVAGTVGFVVDSVTLLALVQGAGWQPLPARLVSMPVAILATWLINRLWTFRAFTAGKSMRNIGAEFLGYCTVQVTGAAASYLGYSAVVAFAGARAPLELLGAVAAGAVLGLVINYFGARIFVFRQRG